MDGQEHFHLFAIEKKKGQLAAGHVLGPSEGLSEHAFRTSTTAAVAVDGASAPPSQTPSEYSNDDYDIHSVLLWITDVLQPHDQCRMNVALQDKQYVALVTRGETRQSLLLGLEAAGKGGPFHVRLVLPIERHARVQFDGDGGNVFIACVPARSCVCVWYDI
eukprot:m.28176 g.28176  ORF g.28176 m.28176 type:complete len:162 (-) comp9019_c2_seq1:206-691(-)